MSKSKVHYAKFKRNQWADVVYPCGIIAEAPRLGTREQSKVTCKRCLQALKGGE
ncbi:MAG: hypothetical protein KAS32_07640 [Candidatus Peribacteraceae bacterium]|nr:hypothetical protein [Candidatus Peribacteraceae bacterium]